MTSAGQDHGQDSSGTGKSDNPLDRVQSMTTAKTPPVPGSLTTLWTELGLNRFGCRDEPSPAGESSFLLTALATLALRGILLPTVGDESRGTGAFPLPAAAVAGVVPGLSPLAIVHETTVRARAVL